MKVKDLIRTYFGKPLEYIHIEKFKKDQWNSTKRTIEYNNTKLYETKLSDVEMNGSVSKWWVDDNCLYIKMYI